MFFYEFMDPSRALKLHIPMFIQGIETLIWCNINSDKFRSRIVTLHSSSKPHSN